VKINLWLLLGATIIGLGLGILLQDFNPFVPKVPEKQSIQTGKIVPDFSFTDLFGKKYTIQDLRGKTVLLNFWASWCPPCIVEFPDLVKRASEDEHIIFLAVSTDFRVENMEKFLADQKLLDAPAPRIILVHDTDKTITQDLFQTYRLPETIIINDKGEMVEKIAGAIDWTEKELPQPSSE
jgi:thiol-disulfide isomerase/thioredoxin